MHRSVTQSQMDDKPGWNFRFGGARMPNGIGTRAVDQIVTNRTIDIDMVCLTQQTGCAQGQFFGIGR